MSDKTIIEIKIMKDLLQLLWDEYKLSIDTIEDINEDHPFLTDTPKMEKLREDLISHGITI
jgi:hypothetical protein